MIIAALMLLQTAGGDYAELQRRVAAQPAVVRRFIERRAMCNHWGGEEPYDAERRREIEAAMAELGCATIEGEGTFLKRYFAASAETIALIDLTADESGWISAEP